MVTMAPANLQQRFLHPFLGYDVISPKGESLGTLWNFAIDLETGELAYAVVHAGDRWFAFLWDEFRLREDESLELQIPGEILRELPGIDPADCPDWRGHPVRLLVEHF
jgi:sporulation protein YlmC with PRC-barrel domain